MGLDQYGRSVVVIIAYLARCKGDTERTERLPSDTTSSGMRGIEEVGIAHCRSGSPRSKGDTDLSLGSYSFVGVVSGRMGGVEGV